ncbi:MAG: large repetitive protein [Thermoleophilaceae bacterium]|nr:large repetitive protein [Thermoleophilaceae bacterium]
MRLNLLAAIAAVAMLALPSAAQAFGCGLSCGPPSITGDTTPVTVAEGSKATVTGSWSNPDVGGVSMTASTGSVDVGSGPHGGTWTWTWTPADGPSDSRDVTVSVGGGNDVTFHVNVSNVAPSATFNAPANATTAGFTLSLSNVVDPGAGDVAGATYSFDCGDGVLSTPGTVPSMACGQGEGVYAVRGQVKDKDGSVTTYTATVGVFDPVSANEGTTVHKTILATPAGYTDPFFGWWIQPQTDLCYTPAPTASIGTITAGFFGALSWSYDHPDGPLATTVTVDFYTQPGGSPCSSPVHHTVQFGLNVANVAPTATFTAPSAVQANAPIGLSFTSPADPSPADTPGLTYSFDCGSGYSAPSATSTSSCPGSGSDGQRTVKGKVIDKDSGSTEYTRQVVVDGTAPDTTITGSPDLASSSTTPAFTWSGGDGSGSGVADYAYRVDGGAWSSFGPATTVTLPALSEAQHTFQVKARDAVGNEDATPASYTWTVDTTAPDTTITTKPPVTSASPTFSWQAPGASSYAYKLDNAAWSGWTSDTSHAFSGLGETSHTLLVKSKDAAGNEDLTPDSHTWNVDATAPDTSITPKPAATNGTPTFSWQAPGAAAFAYNLDNAGWSDWTADSSHAFTGLTDGSHTLQVKSKDAVGNEDLTPDSHTWTVDATPPDTALTSTPGSVSGPSPAFAWSGSGGATEFAYKLDDGAWSGWAPDGTHAFSGLADGSHTFQVKARDAVANEDPSPAGFTWTVQAPSTTNSQSQAGTNGANGSNGTNGASGSNGTNSGVPAVQCKVPGLKKKKLADARKALARAHCRLGNVKKKKVRGVKAGRVASQSARSGAKLPAGAAVNVVVGK